MTVLDLARAPASTSLGRRIVSLHERLDALDGLEPAPATDALFTELVQACGYRHGEDVEETLRDPAVLAVAPRLRELCAQGEYLLERHWARRVLAADDSDAELAAFPYLTNYEQLTALEVHTLAGVGLDPARVRRVAFLGGGPLPLSALLTARRLGTRVDVVDINREATDLAAGVAARLVGGGAVHARQGDARDAGVVGDSDVVVLAALVGLDRAEKRDVVARVARRMRPGAMIVVRSAHGLRTLLYPVVEPDDLGPLEPLAVVHPLNEVVNSVVVAVRR